MITGPQYKRTSAAVLILAIAGLTLPLFLPLFSLFAPFGQCASLTVFGKPCPMCGLTRGFYQIWHLNFDAATELNILSVPLFIFTVLQIIFRSVIVIRVEKHPTLLRLARPDALVHSALAALYFIYAIAFVVTRWTG